MMSGSVMSAMTRIVPPHKGQSLAPFSLVWNRPHAWANSERARHHRAGHLKHSTRFVRSWWCVAFTHKIEPCASLLPGFDFPLNLVAELGNRIRLSIRQCVIREEGIGSLVVT